MQSFFKKNYFNGFVIYTSLDDDLLDYNYYFIEKDFLAGRRTLKRLILFCLLICFHIVLAAEKFPERKYMSIAEYKTYDEVNSLLDSLSEKYPGVIGYREVIGHSWEGREISAIKISDNPNFDEDEPEIFYNAAIHGTEPLSTEVLLYLIEYFLLNYESDPEINFLVNNRELWFVPIVNPDGYEYGERKNRRDNGDGSFGVDLNRNFDYMWGYDELGSKSNPASSQYRGPHPFSEPETVAIRDFCIKRNFKISNNLHFYGYWIFHPWGYNLTQSSDSLKFSRLSLLSSELNGYRPGLPLFSLNGSAMDWLYGKLNIFSFVTEVGGEGLINIFNISPENKEKICRENIYPNLLIAWGPGIIEDHSFITNFKVGSTYCAPEGDSLSISLSTAPDTDYNFMAFMINEEGRKIDSLILEKKLDDGIFKGNWKTKAKEEYYQVKIRQTAVNTPFSFYYYSNLRNNYFTTAGPAKVFIDEIILVSNNLYKIKFGVANLGRSRELNDLKLFIRSSDSTIQSINSDSIKINSIEPSSSVIQNFYTYLKVTENFESIFNFDFSISSSDKLYWKDFVRNYIYTDLVEEDFFVEDFYLNQNYPNPFNPKTTIKYSILKQSNVTLKVYDVLGSEVATLVNKEQPQGNYEVEFSGSKLTSGIYFYRLQAGDFVEAKKMILLK